MQLSDNLRGAALMAASMTAFTVNDTFLKLVGKGESGVGVWQTMFLRGIATTILLGALAAAMGQFRLSLPRGQWRLIALRSLAEVGGAILFVTALFNMELANVSAILQSLPLTVTLAGALVFGERVGWRRMLAILIGFGGVLLIVNPGGADFNAYSVSAILAVVCITVRDLCARRMAADVPSVLVSLIASIAVTTGAGIGSAFVDWVPMSGRQIGLLGASTFFILGGYILSVMAMRVGEIGFVAPFRYTSLLVAMILGVFVFGTFPDATRLLGAAIVVATGLFTLWREWALRQAGRRAVGTPPPPARG